MMGIKVGEAHMHKQHFLLSAKARKISLAEVARWDEETVFETFCKLRWPKTKGEPCCPVCGSVSSYFLKTRRQWRCKDCNRTFSLTSGTWLHSTNLELRAILMAIVIMSNEVKGLSASQLMRHLNVQYKTAFTLYHKLRSALLKTRYDKPAMSGQVQVDGAYLNPSARVANKAKDRPQGNRKSSTPKSCILVIRQAGEKGQGGIRTLTYVIKTENAKDIRYHVEDNVQGNATIVSDEHPAYGDLEISYERIVVNHSVCYVDQSGANTNQAESFFARFRRMFHGQIHKSGQKYLELYANEVAYREDTRRWNNRRIALDMLERMLTLETESPFRGYWSRSKRSTGTPPSLASSVGLAA